MSFSPDAVHSRLADALGDGFAVGDVLGSGSYAVVFRAKDRLLERDVAVKVLDPDLSPSESAQGDFLREARIIARVEHPYIVPLYSAQSSHGLLYLVMRLLPGRTLAERLKAEGALPPGEAARLAHEIAQALAAAHQREVIHRDVKPSNVLLDRAGHAIVTDFGISRLREARAEADGISVGTPGYMSPEQILAEDVDGRSDVYSLGVVLFEMLAGRPPFQAASIQTLLQKHLHEPPPDLRQLRPQTPLVLASLVARTLSKNAHDRPSSAELAAALAAARAPQALLSPRAARWRKYRQRIPMLGIGSIAALLVWSLMSSVLRTAEMRTSGDPPRLEAAREAIPKDLIDSLRSVGVLGSREIPTYVFVPGGRAGRGMFVVSDSGVIIAQGSTVRRTSRHSSFTLELVPPSPDSTGIGGLAILHVRGASKPDTIYAGLSGVALSRLEGWFSYLVGSSDPTKRTSRIAIEDIAIRWVPVQLFALTSLLGMAVWYVMRWRRRKAQRSA